MDTFSIVLKGLKKAYSSKEVLHGINLEVPPGQIIGYIGPNGAGKSTTVKIIAGLIPEYEGEIWVDGLLHREHLLEIKSRIGYVPEQAELYDLLTPREYLRLIGLLYGLSEEHIAARTAQWLEVFGLAQNIDQRMDTFSKGMRQKILLSSGMLHAPRILILDEPLSGLDANAVILVKEILQQLKASGITIFYCSHMMDVVEKVSDRIVLIANGAILADGPLEALRTTAGESLENIFARLTNTTTAPQYE